MQMFIEIIFSTAFLFCLIYSFLILKYSIGFAKTIALQITNSSTSITIIIPARNEEKNIINCLNAIRKQTYPKEYYELIVIDDSSEDATYQLVQEFININKNLRITLLNGDKNNFGKKNAIKKAIEIAKGDLIITTDADCAMNENWLTAIVNYYQASKAKMIVAPVSYQDEHTAFEKMQSLEFMALIASGGGALWFDKAIMCNGANLIYSKEVFYEVGGFQDIENTATGDDVLLMYKIKNKYPHGIKFLKDREAIVYTKAKSSLKEFLSQRQRWASKPFSSLNSVTKFVSLTVYFFNFFLFLLPFVALCLPTFLIFNIHLITLWIILFCIKCMVDFLLLLLSASFFGKKPLLIYFLPQQFLYIVYVVFTGLLGKKKKYNWKGRVINNIK